MNNSSSSYRLWSARIAGGTITKWQCIQYANAIAPLAAHLTPGGKHTNLTTEEAEALYDQLDALPDGLALLPDHEEQGRQWLARYGAKLGLPVGEVERFTFVGAWCYDTNGYGRGLFVPMYRAHLTDGRVFDYAPLSWQAHAYSRRGHYAMWWEEVAA